MSQRKAVTPPGGVSEVSVSCPQTSCPVLLPTCLLGKVLPGHIREVFWETFRKGWAASLSPEFDPVTSALPACKRAGGAFLLGTLPLEGPHVNPGVGSCSH